MTTLLVLSDSHGDSRALANLFPVIQTRRPDAVVHLGDFTRDVHGLADAVSVPILSVAGNCDFFSGSPAMRKESFESVMFLICHGHHYGVKQGLMSLVKAAKEQGCRVALFGHTHQAQVVETNGVLLINPGALAGKGSYAWINVEKEKTHAEISILSSNETS